MTAMHRGFTCSTFDLFHAGHVTMLQEAKSQCDYLIVGLQVDPSSDRKDKNAPVQSLVERYIQLQGCRYVDEIIPYQNEKELEQILSALPIDVRILGEEYEFKEFTGKAICLNRGIDLYYNRRDHSFSSSELRKRVAQNESV